MKTFQKTKKFLFAVLLIGLSSCAGLHFSQSAYDADKRIQTNATQLLDSASQSYKAHAAQVVALQTDMANVLQAEKARGKTNIATIQMWQQVQTGSGNLGTLLTLWKTQDTLSKAMIPESKQQIQRLLNSISDLENYKIK